LLIRSASIRFVLSHISWRTSDAHHPTEDKGFLQGCLQSLRIIDQHGELITAVPRNGTGEISRFKAYGSKKPR
jgi:hypothetical protein